LIHISFTLSYFELYFYLINFFSFLIFGYDKALSLKQNKSKYRISEKSLLFSVFLGGSVGALFAMFLFRHKIKKNSFLIKFLLLFIFQLVILIVYLKGWNFEL